MTIVDYYAILSEFQMYKEIKLLHQAASSIIVVAESSSTYITPRKLPDVHNIGGIPFFFNSICVGHARRSYSKC